MQIGRLEIFTDEPEITEKNVIRVLRNALPKHLINAARCDFLLNYEAGEQPLKREKIYRPEIDVRLSDNIANEVTEFKLGFNHGYPITLVQRGERDSVGENETDAIALLNECYWSEHNETKTQQLFRFAEITGLCYTFTDINTEYRDGDSYFTYNILDPRTTFIIKSSYYVDHRPMLAVSYREDEMGNRYFTCFSKWQRFEISGALKIKNGEIQKDDNGKPVTRWFENERSGEKNPLEIIPIVEWIRSYDRMGCFERQIPEMDGLNIAVSDFVNDVDTTAQAIWWTNDVEFPKDEEGNIIKPESGEWMQTFTPQDGKSPMVNPLSINYDYTGMLSQISYRVSRIKEKCNVPTRNDNSGGSTGIAMSDATGWTNAEVEANKQDLIKSSCKMEEVKIALAAIRKSPYVPSDSPLLDLRYSDVKPSIKRQKNYEMSVKTTALANMLSHGIHGLHALNTINLFDDVAQVWADSKEIIEKYQNSLFEKNKEGAEDNQTTDGGIEAQISNSPMLDGMSKENPEKAEG